ncbi:MAG: hypothetical protein HY064_15140 [Bacteroidetes bacterium]|nr:hypothetical protein [Bacteroidota bacterium]
MKTKLFLIPVIILLLFSCGRKEYLEGSVVDVFTGAPIANMRIYLEHQHDCLTCFNGPNSDNLGQATTGSDGRALFDFRSKRNNDRQQYYIGLDGEDRKVLLLDFSNPGVNEAPLVSQQDTALNYAEYYTNTRFGTVPFPKVPKERNATATIRLASLSRIEIKVSNIGTTNSSDALFGIKFVRGVDTLYIAGGASGISSAIFHYRFFPSDGKVNVQYVTENELGSVLHSDTILVAPFAKTIYQINY